MFNLFNNDSSFTTHRRSDWKDHELYRVGLSEFNQKDKQVEWFDEKKFSAESLTDIQSWMLKENRWRHHHEMDFLKGSKQLYDAYSKRVEAMLEMIDDALVKFGIDKDLSKKSAVDLACSEGFVSFHYLEKGLKSIDCFELSLLGIERFQKIHAYKKVADSSVRLGRIDLALPYWSDLLDKKYDIVFALGIIYHLENPFLFARNLYEITNEVCILESDTPVFEEPKRFRGDNGVIYLHKDQVTLAEGNVRKLLEMRCDRKALVEIMLTSGFSKVVEIPGRKKKDGSRYYNTKEKSLLVCFK